MVLKSRRYNFIPDIATADLAFEAFGKTYNELFENAGLALESAMVEIRDLTPNRAYKRTFNANTIENLLFSFLEELIFLKDAKLFLAGKINCKVSSIENNWRLDATISGEKIDRQRHKLGVDVKAVTKHLFKVELLPDKTYRCQVVLDV